MLKIFYLMIRLIFYLFIYFTLQKKKKTIFFFTLIWAVDWWKQKEVAKRRKTFFLVRRKKWKEKILSEVQRKWRKNQKNAKKAKGEIPDENRLEKMKNQRKAKKKIIRNVSLFNPRNLLNFALIYPDMPQTFLNIERPKVGSNALSLPMTWMYILIFLVCFAGELFRRNRVKTHTFQGPQEKLPIQIALALQSPWNSKVTRNVGVSRHFKVIPNKVQMNTIFLPVLQDTKGVRNTTITKVLFVSHQ